MCANLLKKKIELFVEKNLSKPCWGVLVSYTNGYSYGMFSIDLPNCIDQNLKPILTNEDVKEIMKYGKEKFQDTHFVILNMMPIWMIS